MYICYDKKKEYPTTDGINPAEMGSRRPADTGSSMFGVHLNLSAAVVSDGTSARAR